MSIRLEIPVFGADAALRAVELGASRIELNAAGSYPDGGLTPSVEDLERIANIDIPVRVMIRPRGPLPDSYSRDFIYSEDEFEQMGAAIRKFKKTGVLNEERGDGFVFGILREFPRQELRRSANRADPGPSSWVVDRDRCTRLVTAAYPFKAVYHRAFDELVSCKDSGWSSGLDELAACGFDAILTSGGLGNAIQNVTMLDKIITRAKAPNIEIIIGGGVRRHNIQDISHQLKLKERGQTAWVHSACLSNVDSEYIDAEEVAAILAQLKEGNT
ncbi:hypothetical protein F4819DRAFT_460097 [Hypoxylon fuscum]|nr:hypothetical protein F4819DRAFT_460097 [Hypoxylon fuscum]